MHSCGKKTRSGLFFGYYLFNGGKWSESFFIMDWNALAGAEHPTRVERTKIMKDNVNFVKLASGKFRFPVAEGALVPRYIDHKETDEDISHKVF